MTKEQALDINFLKQNCERLYFFGLGFIQIKINDQYRVHVYTDKIPGTASQEEIHNHRYGFTSQVLKGTLEQQTFAVTIDRKGEFLMTQETCKPGPKPEFPKLPCSVVKTGFQSFAAGSSYHVPHDTFHQVFSKDAVTLLNRGSYKKEHADVVFHKDGEPMCPFSYKISDERLWEIIEEALK
jgi:hypothetical protein